MFKESKLVVRTYTILNLELKYFCGVKFSDLLDPTIFSCFSSKCHQISEFIIKILTYHHVA